MKIHLHQGDLPDNLDYGNLVAIDTETMGLNPLRDRLCLVQLSMGDGECHLVQIGRDHQPSDSPNLRALLEDQEITKIFHYARFDIAVLFSYFGVMTTPIYCTKIVSKLVRTYTDRHGLKDLCKELLGVEISKQEQTSYWGADELSQEQLKYAATDVLYLHRLMLVLEDRLEREDRAELAQQCFDYLPTRAYLDLTCSPEFDVFSH